MKSKIAAVALAGAAALFFASAPAQARYWHHYYGYHDNVGAGIAGFAAGALLGGAVAAASQPDYYYGAPPAYAYGPPPAYGPSVAWCARHYRSYDPRSGTYLGYDGVRHPCP